jgi:transcriptional regulator with XRE-family HTH domain
MPIGERLRHQRVEVLGKSVRDIAKLLDTSPIHVSDIETGKRMPSEELLVKIAGIYKVPESELRAGFARPQAIVAELATESATAVEKVPEFLRTAKGWSREQWDAMIKLAKKANEEKGG